LDFVDAHGKVWFPEERSDQPVGAILCVSRDCEAGSDEADESPTWIYWERRM